MSDAVRIRYERDVDGYLMGAEFNVVSAEKAAEYHPHAKIVRMASGAPYVKPKPDPIVAELNDDATPPKKSAPKAKED